APKVTGIDFTVSGVDPKGRVTCSPMNLSRMGVYLWKQAAEKAGSFDVDKVRAALPGEKFKGPAGEVTMQENHHLINNVFIGETLATGQFKVIKTYNGVAAEPFSDKFLK
ncbi:MAG: transporter substrate-binding protein, partial [Verrucomicrobiota bacterium]